MPEDTLPCDECMCNFDCSEIMGTDTGDYCFGCWYDILMSDSFTEDK